MPTKSTANPGARTSGMVRSAAAASSARVGRVVRAAASSARVGWAVPGVVSSAWVGWAVSGVAGG